ncbi:class II aldolase/adducin family protein [Elioraea sp.]|uniref:class II aldolase/adducin family protein n=1 Tax=Elioraea sp. TaxID=2185103 RepID=UPI0025C554EC|nr:class II aldolase/adducin family protein [Elioraea sp.]
MNVTVPLAQRAPGDAYSEAEWQVRCDLAALYRLVAHHRMTDLIYTHISARVPSENDGGPEHHFLINPYGVLFHEITASSLVKVDLEGNVVSPGTSSRVNAAGFTIHSAIHMARHDAACVIHTHTEAGIAVSAQEHGLLPISQHALKFYGHLAYHDYEGIALDLDERDRLVRDLGQHKAMILRNHGLLVAGRSIAEAFNLIYYLERACQAQISALAGGAKLVLPPEEVRLRTAAQFNGGASLEHCDMAWEAASRLIAGTPDWRV